MIISILRLAFVSQHGAGTVHDPRVGSATAQDFRGTLQPNTWGIPPSATRQAQRADDSAGKTSTGSTMTSHG